MARSNLIEQSHKVAVSATMAATICGINPWDSPYSLWQRIVGDSPPKEETIQMWLGSQLEGVIIRAFTRQTKLKVKRPRKRFDTNFWFLNEDYGYPMSCLLDGITQDSTGPAVVEAKSSGGNWSGEWEEGGGIPLMYWFQVQHQLAVTGWQHAYVPALVGGKLYLPDVVERDDEVISLITDKERVFWNDHVLAGVPPAIDGHEATSAAIKRQYGHAEPGMSVVIQDPEVERLVESYRGANESITMLTEEKDAIGNQLRAVIGTNESAVIGSYAVSLKETTRSRIDTKALREQEPEVAERFTVTSEPTRTLRVSKRKDA